MARPTDPKTSFLRDPRGAYRHDGFGHDNRDDPKGSKCVRVASHSGIDCTGRGPIFSIAGGYVVVSRHTKGAGHSLIEDVTIPGLARRIGVDRVFPIYFHGAGPMAAVGSIVGPGDRIGTIGDTGTGTSKGAFHLHLSVATSLAAAESLIDNGAPARRAGESVAAWGKRVGLVDPLVVLDYLDDLAKPDASKPAEPANPAIDPLPEGETMIRYIRIMQPGSKYHERTWAVNIATGVGKHVDQVELGLLRAADQSATGRMPEILDRSEAEVWRLFKTYETLAGTDSAVA